MGTMYLICGIPASSKSIIISKTASERDTVILSFDAIRRELYPTDPHRHSQINKTFQVMHERLISVMQTGQDVIIDIVNTNKTDPARYIARAKKHHYRIICIFCETDIASAIKDNRELPETEQVINGFISSVYHSFEEPDMTEGWDELQVIYNQSIEERSKRR